MRTCADSRALSAQAESAADTTVRAAAKKKMERRARRAARRAKRARRAGASLTVPSSQLQVCVCWEASQQLLTVPGSRAAASSKQAPAPYCGFPAADQEARRAARAAEGADAPNSTSESSGDGGSETDTSSESEGEGGASPGADPSAAAPAEATAPAANKRAPSQLTFTFVRACLTRKCRAHLHASSHRSESLQGAAH